MGSKRACSANCLGLVIAVLWAACSPESSDPRSGEDPASEIDDDLPYGPAPSNMAGLSAGAITPLINDRIYALAADGSVFTSYSANSSWGRWGGWGSGLPLGRARSVTPYVAGHMFAIGTDDLLYINHQGNVTWGFWYPWGNGLPEGKAKQVTPLSADHMFAIGIDDRLFVNYAGNASWGTWSPWNVGLPEGKARYVTALSQQRLFAIGIDGRVYVDAIENGGWTNWRPWDRGLPTGATRMVTPLIDDHMFAIGSDGAVYVNYAGNASWGTWRRWSNGLPGGRARFVTPLIDGHMFAIGDDDRVYVNYIGDASWGTWRPWGNGLPGGRAKAITPFINGHMFAIASDDTVYVMYSGNGAWGSWYRWSTGMPGAPRAAWPAVERRVGPFLIQTGAQVDAAADIGVTLNLTDRKTASAELDGRMAARGVKYIDSGLWGIIGGVCAAQGTYTEARTPCVITPQQQGEILAAVRAPLATTRDDPSIAGYWLLDDYPAAGILPTLAAVAAVVHETSLDLPPRPTICGYAGRLDWKESPTQTTFYSQDAAYVDEFVNFSSQACDMVALYAYGSSPWSAPEAIDWTMSRLIPAYASYLAARGWNPATTPWIGIPQAFGAGGYTIPSTDALRAQVRAYCAAGVTTLLPFLWTRFDVYATIDTTPALRDGLALGIQDCRALGALP